MAGNKEAGLEGQAELLETYLGLCEAPVGLADEEKQIKAFLSTHATSKIAVVTSGGTAVNLERRSVRFIDNFSTGRRGAATVEHLLENGYAVIMLARDSSASPFVRTFHDMAGSDLAMLDCLKVSDDGSVKLECKPGNSAKLVQALQEYQKYKPRLLHLQYRYLSDYLFKLRMCAQCAQPVGKNVMFILAAAVSDFHIPPDEMAEHKIQSRSGPLTLELAQVPKALGVLRHIWAPEAFFVSFKLETDHDILISKAKQSIEKYDMHLVVANELMSRYKQVSMVSSEGESIITKRSEDEEVEVPMVESLCVAHGKFFA